jgi:N-acetylglucosaminyl-diphospho-decaprenol L-rhamnosyltransferase
MRIAVLIVAYGNTADVARCLEALAISTYGDFVVENAGAQAFKDLVAAIPTRLPGGQPVLAHEAGGNLGFAGGVNEALRLAPQADAWWVLNPDTEPYPDALAAMAARLQVGDCDAVGCTLRLPSGKVQSYGGLWRPWLARSVSLGHGAELTDGVDSAAIERAQTYLNGASMLIGRRFFDAVGGMREDYFLYCEETEWFVRAAVLHAQGATTGAGAAVRRRAKLPIYLDERNKMLLTRDHFPSRLPVAAVAAFVQLFFRYARRGAWRQLGYGLAGWVAGLQNRRGPPAWLA